jgi:uncharacterized membrane protein YjjP (DUF1212 family)
MGHLARKKNKKAGVTNLEVRDMENSFREKPKHRIITFNRMVPSREINLNKIKTARSVVREVTSRV